VLDGTGWYTHEPVKVIMLMVKKTESTAVFRLIKDIDPDAFISQNIVRGVYGQGFEQIKM